MPPNCRQVQVRKTVLVVVEGDTEFAFCRYLKTIGSHGRNLQIHIRNAHGGSPDKIAEYTQRLARQSAYDQVVILFDQDRPLGAEGEKIIRDLGAMDFRFSPCIEGFFLKLLGKPVANSAGFCKQMFHQSGLDEKAK